MGAARTGERSVDLPDLLHNIRFDFSHREYKGIHHGAWWMSFDKDSNKNSTFLMPPFLFFYIVYGYNIELSLYMTGAMNILSDRRDISYDEKCFVCRGGRGAWSRFAQLHQLMDPCFYANPDITCEYSRQLSVRICDYTCAKGEVIPGADASARDRLLWRADDDFYLFDGNGPSLAAICAICLLIHNPYRLDGAGSSSIRHEDC